MKRVRWDVSVQEHTTPSRRPIQRSEVIMNDVSTGMFDPHSFPHVSSLLLDSFRRKLIRGVKQCRIVPMFIRCTSTTLDESDSLQPYWVTNTRILCCVGLVTKDALLSVYECCNRNTGGFIATRINDSAALALLRHLRTQTRLVTEFELNYRPIYPLAGVADVLPSGTTIAPLCVVEGK